MRLVCPNCAAQYEVGEDVIPESGRDVQCSNCGHTWFEQPGAAEHAGEPVPTPEPGPTPEPEPEPTPKPRQRELDPDVADILRKEAQYEQTARQAEADPIETQPDLDLSQDPAHDPEEYRRTRDARDRLARLRGEPEVAAAAVSPTMAQDANAPRRELLPDIEEINSTLRPDSNGQAAVADLEEPQAQRNGGFRRGFMAMVIIALLALAAYVFAPQISAAVPQVESAMTAFADWVDGLRLWLDATVRGLLEGSPDAATDAAPES